MYKTETGTGLTVIFVVALLSIGCTTVEHNSVAGNHQLGSSPSPQMPGQTPPLPSLSPSPLTGSDSPIRSVDFGEVIYPDFPDYTTSARKHGARKTGDVTPSFINYGDVTGDGKEEAMVVVSVENKGSALLYYVYLFTLENRKPKLIWQFPTGDRADGGLRQVFAENGKLEIELYGKDRVIGHDLYLGDEALCCPREFTRTSYKWDGKEFKQDGEPRVFENPEGHGSPIMSSYKRP